MAALGLLAGWFVPALIARDPGAGARPDGPAVDEAGAVGEPARTLHRRAGAGRVRRTASASRSPRSSTPRSRRCRGLRVEGAPSPSAVVGGLVGARVGWGWELLFLVYLVPVGVALAVDRLADPAAAHQADRAVVRRGRRPGRCSPARSRATGTTWSAPAGAGWSPAARSCCCGSSTRGAWGTATCGCPGCSASRWATSAGASCSSGSTPGSCSAGSAACCSRAADRGPQGLPVRPVHAGRRAGRRVLAGPYVAAWYV